MAFLGSKF
jgi:hypothetical protein